MTKAKQILTTWLLATLDDQCTEQSNVYYASINLLTLATISVKSHVYSKIHTSANRHCVKFVNHLIYDT